MWIPAALAVLSTVILGADAKDLPPPRVWTSVDGKFSTKASIVSVDTTNIVLRKSDGTDITVPLTSLSTNDRIMAAAFRKKTATRAKATDDIEEGKVAPSNAAAGLKFEDIQIDDAWTFQLGNVQPHRGEASEVSRPFCRIAARRLKDDAKPTLLVYGINASAEIDKISDELLAKTSMSVKSLADMTYGINFVGPNNAVALYYSTGISPTFKEDFLYISVPARMTVAGALSVKARVFVHNGDRWMAASNDVRASIK